jgi:hypothetical protein
MLLCTSAALDMDISAFYDMLDWLPDEYFDVQPVGANTTFNLNTPAQGAIHHPDPVTQSPVLCAAHDSKAARPALATETAHTWEIPPGSCSIHEQCTS